MEEGRRSADSSGIVMKNRSSSGCLIVRKKGGDGLGGVGSSGLRKVYESKKEKKRPKMVLSDSGSSDELLVPQRRRVGPDTVRVCNGLSVYDKESVEESEFGMKRKGEGRSSRGNVDGMIGRNGEDLSDRKRNRLDVFEFDEYDGIDEENMISRKEINDTDMDVGGRRFLGLMPGGRGDIEREYEIGSSRHAVVDKRKNRYLERMGGLSHGDHGAESRFKIRRDGGASSMPMLEEKFMEDSDKPIRLQGKNGVLKVMVKKKKSMGGSTNSYNQLEPEEHRKSLRTDGTVKRNVLPCRSFYPEAEVLEKSGSFVRTKKDPMNLQKSLSNKRSKDSDWDSEGSDASLKLGVKDLEARNSTKSLSTKNSKDFDRNLEDSDSVLKLGQKSVEARNSTKRSSSTKNSKERRRDLEDSDMAVKLGSKNVKAQTSMKGISSEGEKTPCEQFLPNRTKEGKVRRGSGTEKQKLRERIRGMLLNAGWTIDYRPRRNRDYLDAVYINPSGTAYWSIIKAYDALQKQLEEEDEAKPGEDASPFMPLSDELLSQLTRKTRKKMEREMKRKKRDGNEIENVKGTSLKKSSRIRRDEDSSDSDGPEEKLSSFVKHSGKSLKSRTDEDGFVSGSSKSLSSAYHLHDTIEKPSSGFNTHLLQGRKSRKLGRCTLLVRNSNEGLNSESDGFVPYAGKRTLLSWLIDSGTVQLSQKVQYMNRRRTKVLLEGWITRDGIHCGCCSKILTVSKFEIHAGSKLRQPFQNIYVDSEVSLLDCQVDAWNKLEASERIGFLSVDIDGEDPNDDTCGLCGDGGDLICCDGCPSTFHQSCLDIQILPPGDWHCPNCTCKFCGIVRENISQGDDMADCAIFTCSMCEKKYHRSCIQETDSLSVDCNSSVPSFCGKECRELFEQLQKNLGVKHELEGGFSWTLIHRMDADLGTSLRGFPQLVECNSKLAVALTVMDECFLPIVDRRSGINLIHNVLYNCGSNFNRLNYSGFYTAVLERGDEIICAASIRFHGTQLAEMPFIGTRHIYRRQGMCRRLFAAIESALCSLKVEKLIIPAIAELMHTWTEVFGFTPLDESLKQDLRFKNMLVFPGVDMLQKLLLEQESIKGNMIIKKGAKKMELKDEQCITPEAGNKDNMDSLVEHDLHKCDGGLQHDSELNDKLSAADSASQSVCLPLNETSVKSGSLDASHTPKIPVSLEGSLCADSESGEKLAESVLGRKCLSSSDTSDGADETENRTVLGSSLEVGTQKSKASSMNAFDSESQCPDVTLNDASVMSSSLDASPELKAPVSLVRTVCSEPESRDKLAESASNSKCPTSAGVSVGALHEENKLGTDSPVEGNSQFHKESDIEVADAADIPVVESVSDMKFSFSLISDASHSALVMENKPVMDSSLENNFQPREEGDRDVHGKIVNEACLQPISSVEENGSREINEIPNVSVSSFNGADESSTQMNSDSNMEIVRERSKLSVAQEAVSEARNCEEKSSHAFGDGLRNDACEVENESGCV